MNLTVNVLKSFNTVTQTNQNKSKCFCVPSAVYILLGAGGLMMVVGFFGCFGAVRESQCLLASVGSNAEKRMLVSLMFIILPLF